MLLKCVSCARRPSDPPLPTPPPSSLLLALSLPRVVPRDLRQDLVKRIQNQNAARTNANPFQSADPLHACGAQAQRPSSWQLAGCVQQALQRASIAMGRNGKDKRDMFYRKAKEVC